MAISDNATKTALATSYTGMATHAAAHTALPATSANELTGTGSARGAISWGAVTNGVVTGTATITVPTAGGTAASVGLWSALTAGTFRDGQYDIVDSVFTTPGTLAVTLTYTQG